MSVLSIAKRGGGSGQGRCWRLYKLLLKEFDSNPYYSLAIEEARQRYGEGNYECLEWSKEVREIGDPERLRAGYVASRP